MLTMPYFHPWILRQSDAEEDHVPFAGCLRNQSTWEASLTEWLDGNGMSKESATYIDIFLSVYRARPCDPNHDARSDEDFSEEEFVLTEAQLAEALTTRVGGRSTDKSQAKDKTASGKATHEANSRSRMNLAAHTWSAGDDTHSQENVMPVTKDENVNASLVAARASQRKEKAGPLTEQIVLSRTLRLG